MSIVDLLLLLASSPSAFQPQGLASHGAATITPERIRRQVEIVADDSMEGRATPSPGLERAAAYVAGEFRRLGLRPAGEAGSFEQRWGVSRWVVDTTTSRVELTGAGWSAALRVGVDVRYVAGRVDGRELEGETVVLRDSLPRGAAAADLGDRIVLLPVDYSRPIPPDLAGRVDRLAERARAVLILSNRDSVTFAARLAAAAQPRLTPDRPLRPEGAPVLELHRRGLDPDPGAPGTRARIRLARTSLTRSRVPNLVGVLEGSDPTLRHEYVAISAHVDGVGIRPGALDSINNGADDNASGLAALLAIADAFRDPAYRPRRSLLFLVPSGEERGLWGSAHYVAHPAVPLDRIVALLNMDLIGRNWPDSVIVVGPEFSTLGEALMQTVDRHPELRMAPIADRWPEERIFYRSDHYHFARRGVPILFFTSGTHPDYHQPTDSPDRVDAEKASRVARLVYHVAAAVANAPDRPRWSPESYRTIVTED